MGRLDGLKQAISRSSNSNTESNGDTNQEASGRQQMQDAIAYGGASLVNDDFINDIYNDDKLTPHKEQKEVAKMMRTNPYIYNRVTVEADSIIGKGIGFKTDDPKTQQFFERQIKPKMKNAIREQAENYAGKGNGYVEVIRDGKDVPINFEPIARSEKMYIDFSQGWTVEGYVLQMPRKHSEDSYTVPYTGRSTRTIHGVRFEENEIIHAKKGVSQLPPYGRSGLASAIDDYKVNREATRSKAMAAKFKTAAKKIIEVSTGDGSPANENETKDVRNKLEGSSDAENVLLGNKRVEIKDLDYNIPQLNLEQMLESTEKAMTQGMPSYASHGDVTNYAVAKEEGKLWYLRIQAEREDLKEAWNPVLQEIAEARGLDPEVELEFGAFDFPTRDQEVEEGQKMFKAGIATLNEAREKAGLKPLDDEEEIGDGFKWELDAGSDNPLEDAMQQKLDEMEDDKDGQQTQDSSEE